MRIACQPARCPVGTYLYGCGADANAGSPGVCMPCLSSYLPIGANWTSEGKLLDVATSCWWECENGFDNNQKLGDTNKDLHSNLTTRR